MKTTSPAPVASAPPNLAAIRTKLNGLRGEEYWRSLEEVAQTSEFKEMLFREFPAGASEWLDPVSRRNFLKLSAATLALAGLTACTKQPAREIFPYIKQPEELVLGQPLFYASAMTLGGFATGLLVKSREGHPIKVDGNPEHPAALGGSSVWMQTSILNLYDPDRSQAVTSGGDLSSWALFLADLNQMMQTAGKGGGVHFLTETVTSPTLGALFDELRQRFPEVKWHQYEPITRDHVREGARLAFGEFVETHYHFDRAAVILSLDSDFLYTHPQRLRYTREYINGRRVSAGKREMSRFYALETSPTVTGSMADHRLPAGNAEIEAAGRWLARQLSEGGQGGAAGQPPFHAEWLLTLKRDLQQHRGRSVVVAGEWQSPQVHALAHLLNERLGNVGQTVSYSETAESHPENQLESLRELAGAMKAGKVDTLFIFGGNPVYTAPADFEFGEQLRRVRRSVHLGLEFNETAAACTWHIPEAHYLESWGDARAFDGTITLQQPLIAPLYDGKTAYEILGAFFKQQPVRSDYEVVRAFWERQGRWTDFGKGWRQAIHDGFIPGTESAGKHPRLRDGLEQMLAGNPAGASHPATPAGAPETSGSSAGMNQVVIETSSVPIPGSAGAPPFEARTRKQVHIQNVEVCFRPDPHIWDGRFANNGWLQECPKPLNKLTWDNAVLVSPALAERASLSTGDVVQITVEGRTLSGPVWIMPGQAENTLTLHLGYGRSHVGRVGQGVGFNAYLVRDSGHLWSAPGAAVVSTAGRHLLVATQTHHHLHSPERQIYRATTLRELRDDPGVIKETLKTPEESETLYYTDEYQYKGYKWGMSIDLTACIGCNACVVACEAENNIPVVGKDQVYKNREMLWIRIDTYYRGTLDNPEFNHAPVPCMHCEHAPCELVCPVEATVHDHEGLNLQVYNRCVGTRFCSNNCPYKVRRFNFLRYTDYHTPSLKPMYNPEVTVRWRGVMEKCTYCIQRISAARIDAEKENCSIRDGEIRTACQQACPAQAIIFGDLNTPDSQVARLKAQPLDYAMLGELNVRPRTTYLAKVQNLNADLERRRPVVPPEKD